MRIVIGFDTIERARTLGNVVQTLQFPEARTQLVHVLERIVENPLQSIDVVPTDAVKRYLRMQEDEARTLLIEAQREVQTTGLNAETKLLTGPSGDRIVDYAAECGADLLVLGPTEKNLLERFMAGSVSRKALSSAHCSLLLVKKEIDLGRPLKVVMATDHSAYANRCLKRFRSWAPANVRQLILATVFNEDIITTMNEVMGDYQGDVSQLVRKDLEARNIQLAQELGWGAADFTSRVESGRVDQTLERVMIEEKADILILGSQGKGFQERMKIGSVSLALAANKPYNVLVLRDH